MSQKQNGVVGSYTQLSSNSMFGDIFTASIESSILYLGLYEQFITRLDHEYVVGFEHQFASKDKMGRFHFATTRI